MAATVQLEASEDAIRDAILRHLYEVHRGARSPKSAAVGFRDIQRAMKDSHGLKQQEVARNLDYLVQKGWVREVIEQRDFTTPRGMTTQREKRAYKISDGGIDLLEGGASMYQKRPSASHIDITTVEGVTIIGDGNIVNTAATQLPSLLDDLRSSVVSSSLDEETKLSVAADIDTIQVQLQKPEPDKTILRRAWTAVQHAVTAGEAVELVVKASALLAALVA